MNRYPARLVHSLSQQRNLLRVCRPQLHLLPSERPLDALDELDIVLRDQRDGLAGASGTSGTTDTVDVIFRVCRDIVVDNDVDVRYIQTTIWYSTSALGQE